MYLSRLGNSENSYDMYFRQIQTDVVFLKQKNSQSLVKFRQVNPRKEKKIKKIIYESSSDEESLEEVVVKRKPKKKEKK